jgi:glycosyltransferase involved in cell wall biosynthesis
MKKILVVGALPESLINFRGDLIKYLAKNEFEIIALANPTSHENILKIENLGARFEPYVVSRHGKNPFAEINTFINLITIIRRHRPNFILAYTVKPIVWVGFVMFFIKNIKFIALIEGIGYAFQKKGFRRKLLRQIVSKLYKLALFNSQRVIFLNEDNKKLFINNKIVDEEKCHIIDGIGLNLNYYSFEKLPKLPFKVLMVARFLNEKGVLEYIKAASLVKIQHPEVKFRLLGDYDNSSDSLNKGIVEDAVDNQLIEWIPPSSDIRPHIKDCHLFVLPSYHEGMPRTIMEAMSIGRPILTTNVPGCKNTVEEFVNGFLVEKQDHVQLAEKIIWFSQNIDKASSMGEKSREIAIRRFDVNLINNEFLSIINSI